LYRSRRGLTPPLVAVGFGLLIVRAGGSMPLGNEAALGEESCAVRAVEISAQTGVQGATGRGGFSKP